MKTLWIILTLAGISSVGYAQDSILVQPVPSLPQGQHGSPATEAGEQKEDRVEVDVSKLPPLMRDELERDEKYKGWSDQPVYFDKGIDQYIVHIITPNGTQSYRFDKEGKAITTDKATEKAESPH